MASCVAWGSDHLNHFGSELKMIARFHAPINLGHAGTVRGRPDHRATVAAFDLEVAGDVVVMVMGVEDNADLPAMAFDLTNHRPGFGGIDHRNPIALGVTKGVDVIIPACGNDQHLHDDPVSVVDGP